MERWQLPTSLDLKEGIAEAKERKNKQDSATAILSKYLPQKAPSLKPPEQIFERTISPRNKKRSGIHSLGKKEKVEEMKPPSSKPIDSAISSILSKEVIYFDI